MPITFKSGRGGVRPGSGRKSTWQHRETTLIRVPKALVDDLIEIAHKLDDERALENKTEPKALESEGQLQLILASFPEKNEGLAERALGRYLGVPRTSLCKARTKRTPEDFATWSKAKDPDGIAWRYDVELKKYFQVL